MVPHALQPDHPARLERLAMQAEVAYNYGGGLKRFARRAGASPFSEAEPFIS